jgi:hypothetical protein
MRRKVNILMVTFLLICACGPVQRAADTLGLAAGTAQVLLTEVNQTGTPTITPRPTTTPTPAPLSQPVEMMDGSSFESWQVFGAMDDQSPDLFVKKGDSFSLDPDWQVERVEFVYKWWGNADPVMDYQSIFPAGTSFTHSSGKSVSRETLDEFLDALVDLQPEPGLLNSLTHADDFHAWYIEISGEDGETVLVQSTSNSREDGAPWNVYYNGHYYAYFGDKLLPAIQMVFPHEPYEYKVDFIEEIPSYKVVFNVEREGTQGFPTFTGLLPLRGDFNYIAGVEDDGLFLFIRSEGMAGFIPDVAESVITSVSRVEVTTTEDPRLRCNISDSRTSFLGEGWTVTCPVEQPEGESAFSLPVLIQFSTADGRSLTTKGVLSSYWGYESSIVPSVLPEWMADALARDPQASTLWADHVLYDLNFIGSVRKAQSVMETYYGEAILLGETQWQGKTLRYTVSTPFEFNKYKLTRWSLTREDVDDMLRKLTSENLAKVALGAQEDAVLNLFFSRWKFTWSLPSLLYIDPVSFEAEAPSFCSINPEIDLPRLNEPYEAFSFNGSWYQDSLFQQRFVFVGDTIVPLNYIYSASNTDPVGLAIRPVSLADRRFQAAQLVTITSDEEEGSRLLILLNENLSTRGRDDLHSVLVDYFNNPVIDMTESNFWEVEDIGLVVYPDGTMDFIRCEP